MDIQITLNIYATEIFRKQADFDYISARMNYKMQLSQQFLWSAQQALEKYFKGILLFNGKSARFYINYGETRKKEYGHNLIKLNNSVRELSHFNYNLPDWGDRFIKYLTDLGGNNRYLTTSSYNTPDVMHKLDELVWNIRRFCQIIPDRYLGESVKNPRVRKAYINLINDSEKFRPRPIDFKIPNGELEKILEMPNSNCTRQALVWANLFYGKRQKRLVSFVPMSSSEIPPHERSWYDRCEIEGITEYVKLKLNS